jgi:hypothetical protein
VLELDLFELGGVMTLLMIALSLDDTFWYLKLGIITLAVSAIVIRPLLWNPMIWLGLVVVFVWSYTNTWYEQNNHDFLKLYWCLGVGVALLAADRVQALRTNARILIGLCFLFACLWKVVSPDYLNNAFFSYFLLQDTRFELIVTYLGGLDAGELARGRLDRVLYTAFGDPAGSVAVPMSSAVGWIAPLMTWWTVLIEGFIAVAFLWPEGKGVSKWRDSAFMVFVISTYFVAPILYFAWLLIAMGVVQCARESFRYWPLVYVALFVLVLMRFHIPG